MDDDLKQKIKDLVDDNMDDLEDILNEALTNILCDADLLDDQDSLVVARKAFFSG